MRKRSTSTPELLGQHAAIRLLLYAGGLEALFCDGRLQDRRLLRCLPLPPDIVAEPSRENVESALRQRLKAHKLVVETTRGRSHFDENLGWLTENVGLDAVETQVLTLVAVSQTSRALERTLELFGTLKATEVHELVAMATGLTLEDVSDALRPDGRLIRSGLLWLSTEAPWRWESKVGVLHGLAEQLLLRHKDPAQLLRSNFRRAPASRLRMEAFGHLGTGLDVIQAVLGEATQRGRYGVNVVLHGAAGTGKTTLVRALADELNLSAFEVAHSDRYGNTLKGESRMQALALAQTVLSGRGRNVVVADEAEDIFSGVDEQNRIERHRSTGTVSKARLNALLEENPVPTVWILNDLRVLHPAYLRRCDLILEVPTPPREIRAAILQQTGGHLNLPESWTNRVAELDLSPGILSRAVEVGSRIMGENLPLNASTAIETVLNGQLTALGSQTLRSPAQGPVEVPFRPDLINADADIPTLLSSLQRTGAGRVLCYGPPGSGKTGFGRHVAEATGRSLIVRRPSNLLGRYVGDTEQALAAAFAAATKDRAVLQLDEVDGFLRHRDQARHTWETSMVNEFLTQLETYLGLLVVTTNHWDALDAASLRRFDAKVHFQPPTRDQRRQLLQIFLGELGVPCTPPALREVEAMSGITQGDFALVLRQDVLSPITSDADFVERLRRELDLKPDKKRRVVGFGSMS